MIRNGTGNSRTYQRFCLVGECGGEYTTHTRPELVDMLLNFGFTVVPRITLATDAAIIGGNWRDDAIFRKAEDDGLNFEKFTEEEVLRFLGLDAVQVERDRLQVECDAGGTHDEGRVVTVFDLDRLRLVRLYPGAYQEAVGNGGAARGSGA